MNVVEYFEERSNVWSERYTDKPAWSKRLKALMEAITTSSSTDFSGKNLLDFGCGTGDVAIALASMGARVVAVDASEQMIARGNQSNADSQIRYLHFVVEQQDDALKQLMDRHDFPPFEGAVSSSVLEYVPDPVVALRNIHSVLTMGSSLWFTVPSDDTPRRKIEKCIQLSRIHYPLRRVLGLSKVGRLMHHLSYSNNRFRLPRWMDMCREAGFQTVQHVPAESLEHLWLIRASK